MFENFHLWSNFALTYSLKSKITASYYTLFNFWEEVSVENEISIAIRSKIKIVLIFLFRIFFEESSIHIYFSFVKFFMYMSFPIHMVIMEMRIASFFHT